MQNIHISQLVFAGDSYSIWLGGYIREENNTGRNANISERFYRAVKQDNNTISFTVNAVMDTAFPLTSTSSSFFFH